MSRKVKLIGGHKTFRVTCDNKPIDAHWNFFDSFESATEYTKSMTFFPDCQYGISEVTSKHFNFV